MEKVKTLVKQLHMIMPGDQIVLGLSGGSDSVCLFRCLVELRKEIEFTLYGVHVNHMIRGNAADADEAFAKQLCKQYQVEFYSFHEPVKMLASQWGMSEEEAGRKVRYDHFYQVAKEHCGKQLPKVAVAHQAEDQAETLLFRLARGTGLLGAAGMEPIRTQNNEQGTYQIIRPLLYCSKQEILSYLETMQQEYCKDATNDENAYSRNRIRNQILPELKKVNERAVEHLVQFSEYARQMEQCIQEETELLFAKNGQYSSEQVHFPIDELKEMPKVKQEYMIRYMMELICKQKKDITSIHIEQIRQLLSKQLGKWVPLPYGVYAHLSYDALVIERKQEEKDYYESFFVQPNCVISIENSEWVFEILDGVIEKQEFVKKEYTKYIDYDKIESDLFLRTRESKDRIVIDQDGHSKLLKKFFVDEKIPAQQRNQMYILTDGNQVVWIPGYRVGANYYVGEDTKKILKITYRTKEKD